MDSPALVIILRVFAQKVNAVNVKRHRGLRQQPAKGRSSQVLVKKKEKAVPFVLIPLLPAFPLLPLPERPGVREISCLMRNERKEKKSRILTFSRLIPLNQRNSSP
jgi:hypothetical protein